MSITKQLIKLITITALILSPIATDAQPNQLIEALRKADGYGRIVGGDGRFLGVLSSSRIDEKSICNTIGEYGSTIGEYSLWNRISKYGDRISDISAYNPRAAFPPQLIIQNYSFPITKNPRIRGIDPDVIYFAMCRK